MRLMATPAELELRIRKEWLEMMLGGVFGRSGDRADAAKPMTKLARWGAAALVAGASLFAGAGVASAQSNPVTNLEYVGNWTIYLARSGSTRVCGAKVGFRSGTELHMKLSSRGSGYFMELYNDNWRSVRNGTRYNVRVAFSGGRSINREGYGINKGPRLIGLQFNVNNNFMRAFRAANNMEVFINGGRSAGGFALNGSRRAMEALGRCIRRNNIGGGNNNGGRDPFGSLDGGGGDPFGGGGSSTPVNDPFQ